MKKIYFLLTFLALVFSQWRSYPIQEVILSNCSNENCIQELPKIENADYQKYRYNQKYRQVYTMLYASTYFDWRDQWIWSHAGIDIATKEWTIVYSIWDWTVIVAEEKWDWWSVVTVEHKSWEQIIYSSYAHLQQILVEKWNTVREWEAIWLVWNSWRSTWPHLHFQIEIPPNTNFPFFFSNCPWTISEIVNEWRCQQQMYINTVDPILFLEKWWNIWLQTEYYNLDNSSKEIIFSWFLWWEIDIKQVEVLKIISKSIDQNNMILINYNSWNISVFPKQFETLGSDRNIFINPQKIWFSIMTINRESQKQQIPIIITNWSFKDSTKSKTIFFWNNKRLSIIPTKNLSSNNKKNFLTNSIDIQIDWIRDFKTPIKERLLEETKWDILTYIPQNITKKNFIIIKWTTKLDWPKSIFAINNQWLLDKFTLDK